jgi:phosphatidylinositol glycan class B
MRESSPFLSCGGRGARLWPLSREALSGQLHNCDWRLLSLLALALLVRLAAIIEFPSLHQADENFQLLEQGHRYFFGIGLVPWEFSIGTRSPVLPFLLGLVFAAAEPLVGGPEGYILAARILLALSSLAGVVAVYRMGQRVSSTHAILGGLVTATWFELVYFAGRPLTEALSTTVLLVGLSLASVSDRELTSKRIIYIGFCFGLCLMLRLHLALGILIAWIWVARLYAERWRLMAVGALIPVSVFGIADAIVWGEPFHSYFESLRLNLFQGVASKFGAHPFDWYVRLFAARWSYAAPVLLLLILLRTRQSILWVLVAFGILISHSLIPHKEYRFVFPVSACLIVVAAMASADRIQSLRARHGLWAVAATPITFAAAGAWVAVSATLAFAPSFRSQWFRSRDLIKAEFLLAKQPSLCGILLYDYDWWQTGGYAYLHRNVPIYELRQGGTVDASKVASAFNAVVLKRSLAANFPGWSTLQTCMGSGEADDVCVLMRDGNCTRIPQLLPCTVAPVVESDPSGSEPCPPAN